MHFPILLLVMVSHRESIGFVAETGPSWPVEASRELLENRRRVYFECRKIEADQGARRAGWASIVA